MLETDPIDILLDDDGDLLIDGDGLHFSSGLQGVAQAVRIRLRLFAGEWFLNLDAGVPWWEILGEKPNDVLLRQRLIEAIRGTPGVVEVLQLAIAWDGPRRRVTVTYALRTAFGDTEPDMLAVGGTNA